MKKFIKRFHEYGLEYLFQPGLWMDDGEVTRLKGALDHVHSVSGSKLSYGIFDPRNTLEDIRSFFSRCTFCVMRMGEEPVGFFYNVILQEAPKPAIHAGLVMIARNTGVDLLTVPYIYMALLQRRKYGSYYYTNISSTPSIVGGFADTFSDVWPSHKSSLIKPPKREYLSVIGVLAREYIQRYFPKDEIEVDMRRFVMRSPTSEMGFESDPRKLSRYHKLAANLFCVYWLDYSKGEDLIQVGRVDLKFALKIQLFLLWTRLRALFARKPVPQLQGQVQKPLTVLRLVPSAASGQQRREEKENPKAA